MTDKLRECPCCEYESVLETMKVRKGWEAVIHCNGCLLAMNTIAYDTEEEAISAVTIAWNRRAQQSREAPPKPLTITLDEAVNAINAICQNGGCPPNKDCVDGQCCDECVKNWLRSPAKEPTP